MFVFVRSGNHRDLHVLPHSFPTRLSSDLHGRSLSACRHYDQRQSAARRTRTRTQTRGRKMENDPIKSTVKAFILEEFLPGERPEALTDDTPLVTRSEEHRSELQTLMRSSSAVFCVKKKHIEDQNKN